MTPDFGTDSFAPVARVRELKKGFSKRKARQNSTKLPPHGEGEHAGDTDSKFISKKTEQKKRREFECTRMCVCVCVRERERERGCSAQLVRIEEGHCENVVNELIFGNTCE